MGFSKKGLSLSDVEVVGTETLYKGFFSAVKYTLKHKLFRGGWSDSYSREVFIRGCAVGVLLYDPRHDLVGLLEQFRAGALDNPAGPWLLEVVAGIMESNETPEEVAHRELMEEAGIKDAKLMPMADFLVSPGGTNERMIMYCALADLRGCGGYHGLDHENEDIFLHIVSRTEAIAALNAGLCNNAPLTIALQWLCLHYEDIQRELCEGT